jgi:hypothetical protein
MTHQEKLIEATLTSLKKSKKWIALSLHPEIGETTITKLNNRLFINEGRDGKFERVSEQFYDLMVTKFDSRS